MEEIKKSFRSTHGLDAAGMFVENVKKPTLTKEDYSKGLNVEFLIDEMTVQEYDSDRAYKKGFIVKYKDKLFLAKTDLKKPAGTFSYNSWAQVRTDIQVKSVSIGPVDTPFLITSGDSIAVDTSVNEVHFKLPDAPASGDTVVIRDIGGVLGNKKAEISQSKYPLKVDGLNKTSFILTRPNGTYYFVFLGSHWVVFQEEAAERGLILDQQKTSNLQAGDVVYGASASGKITVTLPVYANTGDTVKIFDVDGKDTNYNFIVNLPDGSQNSIQKPGLKSLNMFTTAATFVFNGVSKVWVVMDSDIRERVKVISTDYTLYPSDHILTFGPNEKEKKTITLTLPEVGDEGLPVKISNLYLRPGQIVNIKPFSSESVIMFNKKLLEFPKRSERPTTQDIVSLKQLTINGSTDTYNSLELIYCVDSLGVPYWVVSEYDPLIERVDPNSRSTFGVISLATQAQANVDKGSNPNKEVAITPETLANRTATEERQGILRTAKLEEIQIDSTVEHDNLIAVTPFMLNKRTPTEKRSGVVIIATQAETNAGTIDTKFVSPKKLNARKASESLTGIAALVKSGGIPTIVARNEPGTLIYDFKDHTRIVTPKVLSELKSTKLAAGLLYVANENEVISGKSQDSVLYPVAVSPEELHSKTATTDRIGFTQTATQQEVDSGKDNFKYVSPKTLNDRNATTSLTGIAKLATQDEFSSGNSVTISTPSNVKEHLNKPARYSNVGASGINASGDIWGTLKLDIKAASLTQRGTLLLASGNETNARVVDSKAVTPKSLASVISSESNSGLIRISTYDELVKGLDSTITLSPKNLFDLKNNNTDWKSTLTEYGFLRIATNEEAFVGTEKAGSTKEFDLYDQKHAISPQSLNFALKNFLPKTGKAYDSDRLDNYDSTAFPRKAENAIIAGTWTYNKIQTFKDQINVTGLSTLDTAVLSGSGPQISIVPKSNAIESSIDFGTKTAKKWTLGTSTEGLLGSYDSTNVFTAHKTKFELHNIQLTGVTDLYAKKIFVGNIPYIVNPSQGNITIGTTEVDTKFQTTEANTFKVTDKTGTHNIITSKNVVSEVGKYFLNIKGGTLTGKLNISNAAVSPNKKEVAPETLITDDGIWLSTISTKANYDLYPPKDGVRVHDEITNITSYESKEHGPGALVNLTSSKTAGAQLWAPQNSSKKFIRSSNADGTWGVFDEILTMNNLPSPEEIGAISKEGLVYENMKVQGWIQIGNLRIRPNPVTKEVDFIWVED